MRSLRGTLGEAGLQMVRDLESYPAGLRMLDRALSTCKGWICFRGHRPVKATDSSVTRGQLEMEER